MFSDYNTPWSEARQIIDEKHKFIRCFADHAAVFDLQTAQSCLSIGAGCGESDAFIVSKLMPQLQRYIAVEPDKENIKELVPRVLDALQGRRCLELYHSRIEDAIDRIEGPVDVVLLLEVLYYIKDYETLLQRLKRLLKPGSKIVVSLLRSDSDVVRAVETLGLKTWQDVQQVEALVKILYPNMKASYVSFICTTDVRDTTIGAFSILTANADVGEEKLAKFKELFESPITDYGIEIAIFEI
ncbi:hypothetical protein CAPTEDRAFT_201393 [Capitella teleta]|uniref:Methyltransferase type 12 domain-containing protein n=1 Tax=Capitella teleta TaxID=283909 RepID=R7TH88_CAPTE|nr:hypothetical protein CAPTEDRAFT_201393 [Capitella teleta]|eukprot:ELT93173.1 hypothetical protein CAPTEDRAFT_201393 [Capitella teleta]